MNKGVGCPSALPQLRQIWDSLESLMHHNRGCWVRRHFLVFGPAFIDFLLDKLILFLGSHSLPPSETVGSVGAPCKQQGAGHPGPQGLVQGWSCDSMRANNKPQIWWACWDHGTGSLYSKVLELRMPYCDHEVWECLRQQHQEEPKNGFNMEKMGPRVREVARSHISTTLFTPLCPTTPDYSHVRW